MDSKLTSTTYNGIVKFEYQYDTANNTVTIVDSVNNVTYTVQYDDSDRIASIAGTDGSSLQYQYMKDNIVSSVTSTINGTTKTTSYSYDDSDKLTGVTTVNGSTLSYAYDSLGRTDHRDIALANGSYVTAYTYTTGINSTTTGKVASISNNGVVTQYTYDANNNISTITSNGQTIAYTYDSLDELVREDNQVLNKTIVYSYDAGGNILTKTEYPYTTSTTLGTATNTIAYTYGDTVWKDKLTSYNGNAITYDAAGNTLTYDGYSFSWEAGRQLAAISGNGKTISYKYNDSGYRTEKTVNGVTTKYYLDGDKVILENTGTDSIYYSYDADDKLVSMTLNGTEYFYIRNGQGDITGLIDTAGVQVVSYSYDSWGKLISIDGSLKDSVGLKNPYRYRGYRYDTETGLYYLQSRYYNPEIGRYISTDEPNFLGMTGTILSYNLFCYCENNPVNMSDNFGYLPNWIIKLLRQEILGIVTNALFNQLIKLPTIVQPPYTKVLIAIRNYIRNSKLEKKHPITGCINDQNDYQDWRLGLQSLDECGCELIAVYNVLRILGKTVPLAFLALEFELSGYVMAYGFLGSSPTQLWRCFILHRLSFYKTYSWDVLKFLAKTSKALIISYWNGTPPISSLHTIAIKPRGNNLYYPYNIYLRFRPNYLNNIKQGLFIVGYCFV